MFIQTDKLSGLFDILEFISNGLPSFPEEELLDLLISRITILLNAEAGAVLLFKESHGHIQIESSFGTPQEIHLGKEIYEVNQGMTGQVFSKGVPLLINNVKDYKDKVEKYVRGFERKSKFGELRHFLGVPLKIRGHIKGVVRVLNKLELVHPTLNREEIGEVRLSDTGFTAEDQHLLVILSSLVSTLVDKAQYQRKIRAIIKIGEEISGEELPLEDILNRIVSEITRTMEYQACSLHLIGEDGMLHIRSYHGFKTDDFKNYKYYMNYGDGIAGEVANTGRVIKILNLNEDNKFFHPEIIKKENFISLLSVPLKHCNRIIGVLNCYTTHPHDFTQDEIRLITVFASYASVIIRRQEMQEEIEHNIEQLQLANETWKKISHHLSHRLRTSLVIQREKLKNLSSAIKSRKNKNELLEIITEIEKKNLDTFRQVERFLNWQGRRQPNFEDIDFKPFIEQIILELIEGQDNVKYKLKIDDELKIFGDKEMLRGVFEELIYNALKFTWKKKIRRIYISTTNINGRVKINVSDNGIGIPDEEKSKLFDLNAYIKSPRAGFGLGLLQAERVIVKWHNGKIYEDGVFGKGASFNIELPVKGSNQ